jgi:hypothetical protein
LELNKSLFHKAVRTVREAGVGCQSERDAPVLRWSWDALTEGRSHSDTLAGCMVCSTTPSSSPVNVAAAGRLSGKKPGQGAGQIMEGRHRSTRAKTLGEPAGLYLDSRLAPAVITMVRRRRF